MFWAYLILTSREESPEKIRELYVIKELGNIMAGPEALEKPILLENAF